MEKYIYLAPNDISLRIIIVQTGVKGSRFGSSMHSKDIMNIFGVCGQF